MTTTTTTLASRIREAAVACEYWTLDTYGRGRMRVDIARELGCPVSHVTQTLKRVGKMGRPRNPERPRCINCGQPLPVEHAKSRAVGAGDARAK